jgi:putative tricarboxylic transport membrane protein
VLGGLLDKSLRRGLVLSDGDILPFFTRPISAAMAICIFAMLLLQIPAIRNLVSSLKLRIVGGSRA